jgi:hypothetical protein
MPDSPARGAGARAVHRRGGHDPMHDPVYGRRFWIGVAVGGLIMLHGLAGLVRQASSTRPGAWAGWLLAILAAHDLLLVPLVLLVGGLLSAAVGHVAGGRLWPPLRAALATAGIVFLVTMPALVGDGRSTDPTNPTLLPNDYPRSLALVAGAIFAAAAIWAVIAARQITSARGGTRRSAGHLRRDLPAGPPPSTMTAPSAKPKSYQFPLL